MEELICVNDNYTADTIAFWKQFGVNYPKEGQIVSIREVVRHTENGCGVRLNEFINPKVPIKSVLLGVIEIEPSFHIKRFAKLSGDKLSKEEIKELIEESKIKIKEREEV